MADDERKDQTVVGGAFIVDGQVVDCNGKPRPGWTVSKDGAAVPPVAKSKKSQETDSADSGSQA